MTQTRQLLQRLAVLLATGFGTGFSPVASGTVGTLPAIPFMFFVWPLLGLPIQVVVAVAFALLAIPICSAAERQFKTKDDGRIVADEYLTFPICMIGLPAANPVMLAVAFVSARVFDILKPEPANRLQAVKGGTGIVLDDVVASLYALVVNHVIYYFLLK
jgi:phosphatidylglycerophosphatase A